VSRKAKVAVSAAVIGLARVLDQYEGRYRELRGAANFGEYVASTGKIADEETLTEPLLASLLEDVLGFGKGDYFPQRGKSGLKPDFTSLFGTTRILGMSMVCCVTRSTVFETMAAMSAFFATPSSSSWDG